MKRLWVLGLLASAGAAYSQDIRWIVNGSGNWTDASKWFASSGPSTTTGSRDVYIDYAPYQLTGGANSFTTTSSANATINRLFSRAAFTMASNTLTLNGASVLDGNFDFQAGSIVGAGTLTVNGATTFSANLDRTLGVSTSTLNSLNYTAGRVFFPSAVVNFAGPVTIGGDLGFYDGVINVLNGASLTKTAGGGVAFMSGQNAGGPRAFNNAGTVTSNTGVIRLDVGGSHSGTFLGSGTGTISMPIGQHDFQTGTKLGSGVIFSGATLNVVGNVSLIGSPEWQVGTLKGSGQLSGQPLKLTVSDHNINNSPTFACNIDLLGGRLFAPNATPQIQGVLSIAGDFACYDGLYTNTGTIRKSAGAGAAQFGLVNNGGVRGLNNGGTVTSESGTFSLYGGGNNTGIFSTAGTGILSFVEGTWHLLVGTTLMGNVGQNGATVSVETPLSAPRYTLNAGQLSLAQNFTLTTNAGLFANGTISGPGKLSLPLGGTFSTGDKTISTTVDASGTVNFPSGRILLPGGTFNNAGTLDIGGDHPIYDGVIQNTGTIKKSGGAGTAHLSLANAGGTRAVNNNGTFLSSAGTLNIQANGTHSGIFTGTGGSIVFPTGLQTFNSCTFNNEVFFNGAAATFNGTSTLSGAPHWTAGTFNGTSTFTGGKLKVEGGSVTMAGNFTFNSGIDFVSGQLLTANNVLTNKGLLDIKGDLIIYDGIFNNQGTLRKSAGAGAGALCQANVGGVRQINNAGTIACDSGTLRLMAGGNESGTFTTTGTGILRFTEGNYHLNAGTVLGPGNLIVDGATLTADSLITTNNLRLESGTVTGTQSFNLSGAFDMAGGTLTGTGSTTLSGTTNLIGGTMRIDRPLFNSGTINYKSGQIIGNGLTLNSGGVVDIQADVNFYDGVINNSGIFKKTGGPGTAGVNTLNVGGVRAFNNSGTVTCSSGTLAFNADGIHTGQFAATGTGQITFNTASQKFNDGASLGNGVSFGGATAEFNDVVNVTGVVTWNNGVFKGTGTLSGGTMNWTSGGKNLQGDLTFAGAVNYTGGQVTAPGFNVTFDGTLNMGSLVMYDGAYTINGALTKLNSGDGYVSANNAGGVRTCTNNGTIEVQQGRLFIDGTLTNYDSATKTLTGGTYIVNPGCTLQYRNSLGTIQTNAARIVLNGAGSNFLESTGISALGTCTSNKGNIELFDRSLTVGSNFATSGQLVVDPTSALTTGTGTYTQTNGSSTIDGLLTTTNATVSGGQLKGKGTISSSLTNTGGIIKPGNPAAILTVSGNYTQGAGGNLLVGLNGLVSGSYGRMACVNATLDGALAVEQEPGFDIQVNDTFRVVSCSGTRTGTFSIVPDPNDWQIIYGTNFVDIKAKRAIQGPAVVSGMVTLGDFIPSPSTELVTFDFYKAGILVESKQVNPAADGSYLLKVQSRGTMDVVSYGRHWLKRRQSNVIVTGSGLTGLNFSLINADIDQDNTISVFDYSVISDYFGATEADLDWLTIGPNGFRPIDADIDGDGSVSVFDYSILSQNFGIDGD